MTMTQEHTERAEIETALAAEAGHDLGCWEWYAEEAIERGLVEEGEHDEITTTGVALITLFAREAVKGGEHCNCVVEATAEQLAAEAALEAAQADC